MKNINKQYETLKNRMYKLLCNKPYNTNRNHVEKIAAQMRYLEKFVQPEVEETTWRNSDEVSKSIYTV